MEFYKTILIPKGSKLEIKGIPNEDENIFRDYESVGRELGRILRDLPSEMYSAVEGEMLKHLFSSENYTIKDLANIKEIAERGSTFFENHNLIMSLYSVIRKKADKVKNPELYPKS